MCLARNCWQDILNAVLKLLVNEMRCPIKLFIARINERYNVKNTPMWLFQTSDEEDVFRVWRVSRSEGESLHVWWHSQVIPRCPASRLSLRCSDAPVAKSERKCLQGLWTIIRFLIFHKCNFCSLRKVVVGGRTKSSCALISPCAARMIKVNFIVIFWICKGHTDGSKCPVCANI